MLSAGVEIGRYRVESLLGAGGMGEVYRAFDTVLRRHVALKVLRADLPDAAARLLREARAAAGASHPGAVAIFDIGETAGTSYIAMELVAGEPLRDFVGRGDIPLSRRLKWLSDIARVLGAAHQKGFVHRDVKPENVMIAEGDAVKVLDFGIAKRTGDERAKASPADESAETEGPLSYRTQEGKVTGTPRYMAPEQLRGDPPDGRTDQYAWGAMAYELISGTHPRAGDGTTIEMLNHRIPEIPFEVAAAVSRALAPIPDLRFPTMEDVAAVVERAARDPNAHESFVPPPREEPSRRPTPSARTTNHRPLVRLFDPDGPPFVRFGWPALSLAAVVLGGAVMMLGRGAHGVSFAGFLLFDAGVLFAYVRPLLARARKPVTAEISCDHGQVAISHARTRNQVIRGVAGASLVADGGPQGGASLVLSRKTGERSLVLELPDAAEATAILRALAIETTPFGSVRWSLGHGPAEVIATVLGVLWRVAWTLVLFFPRVLPWSSTTSVPAAAAATLLAGLAYLLYPRSGAYLLLAPDGITIGGATGPARFVARDTIASVTAEGCTLVLALVDGQRITVDTWSGPFSSRGLGVVETATVALHLAHLAAVTRTDAVSPASATSRGMLESDELEVGDRTERDRTRRTF